MHMLFDITILGFAAQTFEAHATGIVKVLCIKSIHTDKTTTIKYFLLNINLNPIFSSCLPFLDYH